VSGSTAPQNVHNGEVFGPAGTLVNVNGVTKRAVAPTITFNPAAIPAGTELSFGDLPPGSGMHGVAMGLIDANSYTCTSSTMAEVSEVAPWAIFWPAGQS
jgi:hypothetical protein